VEDRTAKVGRRERDGALDPVNVAALARTAAEAHETIADAERAVIAGLQKEIQRHTLAIEHISEGVSYFSADQRLILCNARYAEIYRLDPKDIRPGMTLREIVELRVVAGTSPKETEDYLAQHSANKAGTAPDTRTATLSDGRRIEMRHHRLPGGGWISTHEDVTEASRTVANERITLQTLIDWVPDNIWVKDANSCFVIANQATARRMGRSVDELIGKSDLELCPPELAQGYFADEQRVIETGRPMIDKEEPIAYSTPGEKTWILTSKVPLRNDQDKIIGVVGISRDISERRRADILRDSQARILEKIAVNAPVETVLDDLIRLVEMQIPGTSGTIQLTDHNGMLLRHGAAPHVVAAFAKAMDGLRIGPQAGPAGAAVHRGEAVVIADMRNDPLLEDFRDAVAANVYRSCWSIPILSPTEKPLGVFTLYYETKRVPEDAELRIGEAACHIAGIAIERKLAEERIHFMANHDALTGLPNRALLQDRLEQALRYAQRADHWVTVAFIDLDNFKIINDTLGHTAGDELLKTVAARMVSSLRAVDTVVRIGGDEFVVLLVDQQKSVECISATISKLRAAIGTPLEIGGQTLRVSSSIGLANYPNDGKDADTLLANADAAMYRAKELGRDNFQFYTPELNAKVRGELMLQEALRGAVERHEFILLYQPQIDMLTGHVFAVEALIRWNHPTQGQIPPNDFIPIADQTGLIVPIGDWVLMEACRQNKAWQEAGLPPIKVCVNVSARQFAEKNFVSRVTNALEKSELNARYLELELTESLIMRDIGQAIATMNNLQRLGVQIAIDDFGTGYSSLSALKTFPVARLKIDKSFIKGLPMNVDDRAVTTAVISLGKKLNLRIVAEGVENDDQIAFLRKNKCDELQGFHFSRPIPPGEIGAFLHKQNACTAA
jgi:diguanylate cyclase (GGDEF)-like protein/PAS domain S-box-containing protein